MSFITKLFGLASKDLLNHTQGALGKCQKDNEFLTNELEKKTESLDKLIKIHNQLVSKYNSTVVERDKLEAENYKLRIEVQLKNSEPL